MTSSTSFSKRTIHCRGITVWLGECWHLCNIYLTALFNFLFIFILIEKIRQRYADLPGELHIIELEKDKNGLGLSLAGNKDRSRMSIFVVGINPEGPVATDGRMRIGDELLEVRGIYFFTSLLVKWRGTGDSVQYNEVKEKSVDELYFLQLFKIIFQSKNKNHIVTCKCYLLLE